MGLALKVIDRDRFTERFVIAVGKYFVWRTGKLYEVHMRG
jgi:hypothetical protein